MFMVDQGGLRACTGDETYYLGIIDILQAYNVFKKMETGLKGMVHKKGTMSSVPPPDYQQRFVNFMENLSQ